ncbi:hypothetical protein DPEC_G00226460 [Dallia pectoralis]|uniref:Uncharacterized protein n=1 Tax=Dallia pectoralis TaxID=75939 RepID=A0ACC2G0S2_DALPE|nr:hypothetical protein DPEC_G00226460 [Dallia pectoralis]
MAPHSETSPGRSIYPALLIVQSTHLCDSVNLPACLSVYPFCVTISITIYRSMLYPPRHLVHHVPVHAMCYAIQVIRYFPACSFCLIFARSITHHLYTIKYPPGFHTQ